MSMKTFLIWIVGALCCAPHASAEMLHGSVAAVDHVAGTLTIVRTDQAAHTERLIVGIGEGADFEGASSIEDFSPGNEVKLDAVADPETGSWTARRVVLVSETTDQARTGMLEDAITGPPIGSPASDVHKNPATATGAPGSSSAAALDVSEAALAVRETAISEGAIAATDISPRPTAGEVSPRTLGPGAPAATSTPAVNTTVPSATSTPGVSTSASGPRTPASPGSDLTPFMGGTGSMGRAVDTSAGQAPGSGSDS